MWVQGGIGLFPRGVTIPNAVTLNGGSPALGLPELISVLPGAYSSATPGWVNFNVPNYTALTITLRAAGGGGSSDVVSGAAAGDGEQSQFLLASASPPGSYGPSMFAYGGLAGIGPVPADQGGSGGVVTVGGGGAGGVGIIGAASGSANYAIPGTYTFYVPAFTSLTATVRGAGGGGSSSATTGGVAYPGGGSQFGSVIAQGGDGAGPGVPGRDGNGSGGTVTGGGGGSGNHSNPDSSCWGGNGGQTVATFSSGALGSTVTIVVGAAGADDVGGVNSATGNGQVLVSWTYTAAHPATYYSGSTGGRVTANWNRTDAGAPTPGTIIGVYIGNGGAPAVSPLGPAQRGAPGKIDITWS